MSHRRLHVACRTLLLFPTILVFATWTCGEETRKPKAAPWNIQSVRQQYYAGLDAARQDVVRQLEADGVTLSYNTDGTVVRDDAFEKAT